jgi:hypothetical protein
MAKFAPFIALVGIGLLVFALVDVVTIDSSRVRHIPKGAWIALIIVFPFLGPLLWLLVGREHSPAPRNHGRYGEPPTVTSRARSLAPDDDPDFLLQLRREREQEERIRKLEARLAELDTTGDAGGGTGSGSGSGSTGAGPDGPNSSDASKGGAPE